ncbi:HAMP domain-containing histidine kinase [Shimazuella sp. AN120528]|uniref:sensor histidine kinase n=1 Tax=Shimazuella soli TaxID=1892854 RepID=UPI001F114AED|nr:HAMP domain-containing sensor histidine kinase [Shimazuella soli]MCH5583501.1 HAMP domain-containing histidine kinase [Shimazuella soli]
MRNSLKIKSGIFLAVLLIATVSFLGFLILRGIKNDQEKRQETYLREQSNIASVYVEQTILAESNGQVDWYEEEPIYQRLGPQIAMRLGTITGMHIFLYNDKGEKIGSSGFGSFDPKLVQFGLQNKIAYKTAGDMFYYVAPLKNGLLGAVGFVYSLQESNYFYHTILNLFLQFGIVVIILSFLISYFYFYPITNGILRLKEATEQIEQGKYITHPPLKRSDELGKLSQGVYSMSQQIEQNIITMKQEQAKLNMAVKKLKQLEKQQKVFIGNITHEFKTPLSVILAYMDLLEMYRDDPTLVDDARENIKKEAERLYHLVEKVLHLASVEKYDFEIQQEKIESSEILAELCERMRGKAQKFDVDLKCDLRQASVWMDKESFYLIFINLLDNAIKYNVQGGSILLTSEVKENTLNIKLQDTGIGIPLEAIDKIFEPFYTVNKDRAKSSGGTGLGLALVKQLVERQQGTIVFHSEHGHGTEVCLTFPLYDGK